MALVSYDFDSLGRVAHRRWADWRLARLNYMCFVQNDGKAIPQKMPLKAAMTDYGIFE
jgi:hypothetical protein